MKKVIIDVEYDIGDEMFVVEQIEGFIYKPIKVIITGMYIIRDKGLNDIIYYYKDNKRPFLDKVFRNMSEAEKFAKDINKWGNI